jgi:GNAT superfamily N-acetyltransferase
MGRGPSPIPRSVYELAEESATLLPLGAGMERLVGDRFVVIRQRGMTDRYAASVHRVRLPPEGVLAALRELRSLFRSSGHPESLWYVDGRATPDDLAERLLEAGLAPDPDDPVLAVLALVDPPPPAPADVSVTRVETIDDYRRSIDIMCEAFGIDPENRAVMHAKAEDWLEDDLRSGRGDVYLAWLDGEAVARGKATYTERGVFLFGGCTLPAARGRGAYRALVAARWDEAVRRGTPGLVVEAGRQSRPILERLGFRRIGEARLLVDRHPPAGLGTLPGTAAR